MQRFKEDIVFTLLLPFVLEVSFRSNGENVQSERSHFFQYLHTSAYCCSLFPARWLNGGMGTLLCASLTYHSRSIEGKPADPWTTGSAGIQSGDDLRLVESTIEKHTHERQILRPRTTVRPARWFHPFQSAGRVKTAEKWSASLDFSQPYWRRSVSNPLIIARS